MTETPDEKYESIDIHTNPEPEEPHKEDEDIDQPMIAEPTRGYGNQNILENVSLSASTAGDDEKITKLRKKLVYGWTRLSIWRSWFVLGSSLLTECVSIIWLIFAIAFFFLVPGSFIQILMTVFFLLVALSGILSACPLPLFPMYPRSVFACMMVLSVFISFILMIANFFLTFVGALFQVTEWMNVVYTFVLSLIFICCPSILILGVSFFQAATTLLVAVRETAVERKVFTNVNNKAEYEQTD